MQILVVYASLLVSFSWWVLLQTYLFHTVRVCI